ncbi:DUF2075 domain-containing protein [Pontiellaceae bacterium B12227]|nr:DUF2075 domain-containing protein [Pontiellaceae bacterium B12227]
MNRAYYSDSIKNFVRSDTDSVLGKLMQGSDDSSILQTQQEAWRQQIEILRPILQKFEGSIYFEYSIPRMGERIDVVLLIGAAIFVLEFKVGEKSFSSYGLDQVCDYALDLKNFHESSHHQYIAPVLIATEAEAQMCIPNTTPQNDKLLYSIKSNAAVLPEVIDAILEFVDGETIDVASWEKGRYCPTPTIIEAALALYRQHSVADITRNDAKENLTATTDAISEVIRQAKERAHKAICFVTGVPGAGKTLIGLNIATRHFDAEGGMYSVLLSGNKPLVEVLQEALVRDKVEQEKAKGNRLTKKQARSKVKAFVQIVHHYRDECIRDLAPPADHIALFDEAQRAWNRKKTADFMQRNKKIKGFDKSEPEFLISCIDRHDDWGVIVCLVGGGQEIHTGEAGISEWIEALNRSFPDWHVHISDRLTDDEYDAGTVLEHIGTRPNVSFNSDLHLSVSMRSFRAEHVSQLIKQTLDLDVENARQTLGQLNSKYPIVITRDLTKAKQWMKKQARGTERYGIVVSSQAERLKPHAIDVKSPMNPVHWFLAEKDDVRSSYYLEDVATEFHIQGLELDWVCVTWDADFRYSEEGWVHRSFRGSKWQKIHKAERQAYLKNAYRVLLTRARQGMVIVIPPGDPEDPTREPSFYDSTFEYLKDVGFKII